MLQDSSGGSFPSDSADSGRMLQDSRGEDPFHLTQQTQEGCFRTPAEDPFHLTQQTQEGCFRTPEERILSI
ncbi:hypothetical protein CesoFtcFv8_005771 [Champsocephalus esox]|uniref:Uncharacterized protein n=1 Tax=Champsocephalus esox TaxID=159716 RepID=A0AAN8CHW1_9TELE|nr:hypothetical protein CesoFtcFv8_005771 [Champsocephalus esox]